METLLERVAFFIVGYPELACPFVQAGFGISNAHSVRVSCKGLEHI